ncbi:MAG: aminotransferase DegT [Nitrospiraceae bacterium]|nr:MAG: aminotransferase DegT [Nitrospiraceae bacterium]
MNSVGRAEPVPFIDLAEQLRTIRHDIDAAIARVLDHGRFIMGPEVAELEQRLAEFCGARHVVTCANGTDALVLALRALGVGPGDTVIVPSFTFCATAEAVCLVGATPLFVDVLEDTYNMDPASLEAGIARARELGLRLRAVITVDLFGQPCDYDAIEPLVRENGLALVCDAAQAFGAEYRGRKVGTIGDITTTSFFPAKPLGCYGDGGAVFTDDEATAALLRSLRVHGQGADKYDNVRIGTNSRLDTLQAAILLQKLAIYPDEIEARNRVAEAYSRYLEGLVGLPTVIDGARSVWAQYTIRTADRDRVAERLHAAGIPTQIYYRVPLHLQPAYREFPRAGELDISEMLGRTVLSLPMHPRLETAVAERVAETFAADVLEAR